MNSEGGCVNNFRIWCQRTRILSTPSKFFSRGIECFVGLEPRLWILIRTDNFVKPDYEVPSAHGYLVFPPQPPLPVLYRCRYPLNSGQFVRISKAAAALDLKTYVDWGWQYYHESILRDVYAAVPSFILTTFGLAYQPTEKHRCSSRIDCGQWT